MYRFLGLPVAVLALAVGAAQGASPALHGRLVYSSDRGPNVHNSEIYALSTTGRLVRDLTQNQGYDGGASVSPNGRRIAFCSERVEDGRVERGLFVMNVDGSHQRWLTPAGVVADGQTPATWSPDGRRLAFAGSSDQRWGIWLVGADGSGLRLLAENAVEPQWEPHGTRIAYDAERYAQGPQVETVDVETGARKTIGEGYSPDWSRDSRSLAFVNLDSTIGATNLFVAPSNGSGPPVQVTHVDPGGFVISPIWSPKGRSVLFQLAGSIYTINPDGTQMRRLRIGGGPSWSPSGKEIAYLTGHGVRVMRANGTQKRQLRAKAPGYVTEPPVWTRDGKQVLVKAATDRSQYDLFVSNADGSGFRRLTHTKEDEVLPQWSPDRHRIAFVRGAVRSGGQVVWVSASSGLHARLLHTGTYPSWSTNGKRLAFEMAGTVYTMSDRGKAVRRIVVGQMPAWSPNGASIAYFRDDRLFVYDLRGRAERELADLSCGDPGEGGDTILQQPEWSPNSKSLAVTRTCDRGRWADSAAWLFDAATGTSRDFPPGSETLSRLAWSPDGKWIAFVSSAYLQRIQAAILNGSDRQRINLSAGDDRDLDWR